jgi:hypothetical protein
MLFHANAKIYGHFTLHAKPHRHPHESMTMDVLGSRVRVCEWMCVCLRACMNTVIFAAGADPRFLNIGGGGQLTYYTLSGGGGS